MSDSSMKKTPYVFVVPSADTLSALTSDFTMEEQQDRSYFSSLSPSYIRSLQKEISALCDQYDYEGSFLYDTYPDKLLLESMANAITEKTSMQLSATSHHGTRPPYPPVPPGPGGPCNDRFCPPPPPPPYPKPDSSPDWFSQLLRTLLFQEIDQRRRCHRRRCR